MHFDFAKQMACWAVIPIVLVFMPMAEAEEKTMRVDLAASDAAEQWHFSDKHATVADGGLRLDGGKSPTYLLLNTFPLYELIRDT